MQTSWNTGCGYSMQGQRIGAVHRDGVVRFYDLDRNIAGEFAFQSDLPDEKTLQSLVMRQYRYGNYQGGDTNRIYDECIALAESAPIITF